MKRHLPLLLSWSAAPAGASPTQRKNFRNVQIDAIGVGLASAAAPFLPVFLTRLGATNFQVGLLAAMPAVTGLLLAILIGRFLQGRRNVVTWFGFSRLLTILCYALTGLVTFFVPEDYLVFSVILIWAAATIPQTMVNIAFSVVMNAVAGPEGRYDLMSRRWSILGFTTAITVALAGQLLDHLWFPLNYQVIFIGLSIGGLISFYFSTSLDLPESPSAIEPTPQPMRDRLKGYFRLIRSEPAFVAFTAKQFVFMAGTSLAIPLFPLYYVRDVQANDTWIGFINMAQTAVVLIGYTFWVRQSRRRGGRYVLLWTTFCLALHPALTALTHNLLLIVLYAGLAGIFQAGLNLVFFDEQMKTFPPQYSATFVSLAQCLQYLAAAAAPLLGTLLAGYIGLDGALLVSTGLRFVGFGLFAWDNKNWPRRLRRRRRVTWLTLLRVRRLVRAG